MGDERMKDLSLPPAERSQELLVCPPAGRLPEPLSRNHGLCICSETTSVLTTPVSGLQPREPRALCCSLTYRAGSSGLCVSGGSRAASQPVASREQVATLDWDVTLLVSTLDHHLIQAGVCSFSFPPLIGTVLPAGSRPLPPARSPRAVLVFSHPQCSMWGNTAGRL